ncbi:cobalamin biosynthesis protein CobT [Histomonas meleagridis]|uniref:cobalamin biosynthesis protein CobT n=1 Tax=Histomonas meleagridis TaxID=135588 RepID=UPI00355AA4B5|nr:cobalamin biosynthesis protein CobT [Histomonas meleagridis]KAH0802742.1 cobalamin biosynthesis protein CobT [Histomonas meleagridis]
MAPELLQLDPTPQSDVYSLGVILFEMITGKLPLEDSADKNDLMSRIKDGERDPLPESEFKNIIENMLSQTPENRPSIDSIFEFLGGYESEISEYIKRIKLGEQSCHCGFEANFGHFVTEGNALFQLFKATLLPESENDQIIQLIHNAAEKKLPHAMFEISIQLEDEDPKRSLEFLKNAAIEGHIQSISKLGIVALQNKNIQQAAQMFKISADGGDIFGISNYGKMLLIGAGVPQDIPKGIEYLQKGVEQGDSNCQFILGSYLIENDKYEEGFKLLQLSGQQGNVRSQLLMAFELSDKTSPKYNPEFSYLMLQQLANNGVIEAMLKLGNILKEGNEYIKPNPKESYDIFMKAMAKGSQIAMIEIAEFLIEGKVVPKDTKKGIAMLEKLVTLHNVEAMFHLSKYENHNELLKKAADNGHPLANYLYAIENNSEVYLRNAVKLNLPIAMNYLGELILSKKVNGTEDEAMNLFKTAAKKGFDKANYNVGLLMLEKNDRVNGLSYIQKAALNGLPEAVYKMGVMVISNEIDGNLSEGIKLIEAAANDGYPLALYELGMLYLDGKKVDKDEEKGKKLLREAADKGYEEAKKALNNI